MNKQAQLKALAKRMKPMHLKMAVAIAEGKNNQDAYIAAKGKAAKAIKNPRDAAYKIMQTNVDISIYAELSKECVVEKAQKRGLMTFEAKAHMLEDVMAILSKGCVDKDGNANIIDAAGLKGILGEHNKMTGDLAAVRTENLNKEATQEEWLDALT